MDGGAVEAISAWVVDAGLAGTTEVELLHGFCARLTAAGLPLCRGMVLIDTLHPIHEGRVFRWRRDDTTVPSTLEYGRTNQGGEAAENWLRSPFYDLVQTGAASLRRNFTAGDPADFPVLEEIRGDGITDYLALIQRFAPEGSIGEMDCVYSSWTSDAAEGFAEWQVAALKRLVPKLALAIKCASLARIAETLVQTYLGRDAGRRVLAGRIERGVAERIGAVLWYSDLRGFTAITDNAPPEQIIPLLNDYAEAVIAAVHEAGGDVLKLIGDGVLAIFKAEDAAEACAGAMRAERSAREAIAALNIRRAGAGLQVTQMYLGLHVGEVFYGNVGAPDRLDFTVVGPAVNEVSRVAAMCRSAERGALFSSAFAAAAHSDHRERLVSVGRYALRGVGRPQELFTLAPEGD